MQYNNSLALSDTLGYLMHNIAGDDTGTTANLYHKRHCKAPSFLNA
jgi:hypothetical protein